MKSKTMRHAIKVRLFAAVLLATCVFAGAANAETMAIKFNLPFEVHWGKNLLPAGEYSVTMDSSANVGLVRSANGKVAIYTPIPIKAYSRTGQHRAICSGSREPTNRPLSELAFAWHFPDLPANHRC